MTTLDRLSGVRFDKLISMNCQCVKIFPFEYFCPLACSDKNNMFMVEICTNIASN